MPNFFMVKLIIQNDDIRRVVLISNKVWCLNLETNNFYKIFMLHLSLTNFLKSSINDMYLYYIQTGISHA